MSNPGFGARLRELRAEKGLSQAELSKMVNVSKSSINMYERGEREPGFETLDALANLFNVQIDYLLGRTEKRKKGLLLKDKVKEFKSDYGANLQIRLDSWTYETLKLFAKEHSRTLEDEINERLYRDVNNEVDEIENAEFEAQFYSTTSSNIEMVARGERIPRLDGELDIDEIERAIRETPSETE